MKKFISTALFSALFFCAAAQTENLPKGLSVDTFTDEYLDTLNVKKKLVINDYTLVGFSYGVNLSQVSWNPPQSQDMILLPMNVGFSITKYGKMFGYMPFFGFQAGVYYTKEGYQFEYNEEKDYTYKIEGAEKAVYDVIEVPLLMHGHYDLWNFKIFANLGCYAGYRLAIQRFPGKTGNVSPEIEHSFLDTDRRWDYGIKGGVGFGIVFDPIEIHIQAMYKYSLGTLYEPDHYSDIYYRYAYPTNIVISAGVHFQLTKRSGMTRKALKEEARKLVYGTN